jgi:hypothetical protein
MTRIDIATGQDPADWQGVIWTGAVEVHVSQRAVGTLLRARDKDSRCRTCNSELPPTLMGRQLMIDPQLPGESLEIVYASGQRTRFELVGLK